MKPYFFYKRFVLFFYVNVRIYFIRYHISFEKCKHYLLEDKIQIFFTFKHCIVVYTEHAEDIMSIVS